MSQAPPSLLALVVVAAAACGGEAPPRIDVLLVTDYVAQADFSRIRSELAVARDVAPEFVREQVLEASAFATADPVASFELDEEGQYIVRVSLLDAAGVEVVSESVRVEVSGVVRATVVISHDTNDAGSDGGADAATDAATDAVTDAATDAVTDAATTPFCDPADPNLVGCWTFEGNANDSSANGHHLRTSVVSYEASNWGTALRAGPTVDARVDSTPSLVTTDAVSFEGFVLFDSLPSAGRMSLLERSSEYAIHFLADGSVNCTVVRDGGTWASAESRDRPLTVGSWYHFACVFDGSEIVLYVDGAPAGRTPLLGPIDQAGGPLVVGSDAPDGGNDLDGLVDEVRIFRSARTEAEIAAAAAR